MVKLNNVTTAAFFFRTERVRHRQRSERMPLVENIPLGNHESSVTPIQPRGPGLTFCRFAIQTNSLGQLSTKRTAKRNCVSSLQQNNTQKSLAMREQSPGNLKTATNRISPTDCVSDVKTTCSPPAHSPRGWQSNQQAAPQVGRNPRTNKQPLKLAEIPARPADFTIQGLAIQPTSSPSNRRKSPRGQWISQFRGW